MNIVLCGNTAIRRERLFRDRTHPLEWNDVRLKQLFRFERQNLLQLIDSLAPSLESRTLRNHSIPATISVCVGLHYLATGSFQTTVAEVMGVSQKSVSQCYWKFVQAVNQQHAGVIQLRDIDRIQAGFRDISNLPEICGAIDCTHIRILRPNSDNFPNEYINRKGHHSINVQAVCDSKGYFLDVVSEWPGSTHDSRIFKHSDLFHRLRSGEFHGAYLVGDGGYPLYSFLMTPYRDTNGDAQESFNMHLSRARVSIEMAFGRVKRRFACLYRIIQVPLSRVCRLIVCTFILHNLAMLYNDPDFDDVEHLDDMPSIDDLHINRTDDYFHRQGTRKRQELTSFVSN